MPPTHYTGNAGPDSNTNRGWILGHFLPDGIRSTPDLEVKWGIHPQGEERAGWAEADPRHTLLILISGRFRLDLPGESVVLAKQGDYVVWSDLEHSWQAEEESVAISIRWPSL